MRHSLSPFLAAAAVAATLQAGGCSTPGANAGSAAAPAPAQEASTPNFGPSVTDTRTAAVIQQMEIDYIAAKNSTPTSHHLALTEKKAKEDAQAEAARKAEAEKQAAAKTAETKP